MSRPNDTKCIKCSKKFLSGQQNLICCDNCDGWLHVKCAGLKLKQFHKLRDPNAQFLCTFCENFKCGKCSKPVYDGQNSNAIECSVKDCGTWYHLRCTDFTLGEYVDKNSRLHTHPWFCPLCTTIPFSSLKDSEFAEVVSNDDLKIYFQSFPDHDLYHTRCSVCSKKVHKNKQPKSFLCSGCSSYIHRKCTNISTYNLLNTKPSQIRNWYCNTCMSEYFPFQSVENSDLYKLEFNSQFFCPCQANSTDDLIPQCTDEFSLSSQLYDPDTVFSHGPDHFNNLDKTLDINAKCNYYTNHDFHKLTLNTKNSTKTPLSVLHTNIQSLSHNFDSLEKLCTDLDYSFDIIALSETWNPEKDKSKFIPKQLENYNKYNGLTGTTLRSGCGFYIRTGIKFKDRKDLDIQHYDSLNEFQCKFIEIINTKGCNFIVCVCYRHPKKTSDDTFNNWLQNTLEKTAKEHKTIICIGDFNYNLLKYSHDNKVTQFVDIMTQSNLQPTINKPTRIVKNQKPSLIDNIFVNSLEKKITTGNLVSKITDHMPNFMFMNNHTLGNKKIPHKKRCFKNYNAEEYQKDMESIDIIPALHMYSDDISAIMKFYQDQALAVMNKHAPFVTLTKQEMKWKEKPWIDRHIQKLIKDKDCIYSKYLKNKSKFWYIRYRSLCDIVKSEIASNKKKYFDWYFKSNIDNSKKIWKGINEIIHNKSSKDNEEVYLDDDGCIITDQKKVANKFNKFYTNVADKLVRKLGNPTTKFQDYLKNPNKHSIFLNETDPGEVATLIQKLDINKSGDIYGINARLIKDAGPSMATNLSTIFNLSIRFGIFPQPLKTAKVIPIYKADSKMLPGNYRPISLLPIIGKLLERIIFIRMSSFVKKYNILFNRQYGFQTGKSTEHAHIDIQNSILNSIEKKETPCCIFLDFAKAFDTVNHSILLQKLNHYGIRGNALSLIESYLKDREQCVQVNNAISDFETIKHGVPQGSILGPLLFLLYINDIAESSHILDFYLFADDTTIFHSDTDARRLEQTLNTELVHVSKWLTANKLSLNVGKSNFLLFRQNNKQPPPSINITINGLPVDEKEHAKYLGILVDNKLSFKAHIDHVKSRLVRGCAILGMVRHYVPKQILINTYNAHIQPHIDYCLPVWGYTYKSHLTPVLRQQRKAVRTINFLKKRDDPDPFFKSDNLLPLGESLKLSSGKLLWKAKNHLLPSPVESIFTKRNEHSFHVPHRRIDLTQHCISYSGVQVWNKIPQKIKLSGSINSFKFSYKKVLLNS